MKSSDNIKLNNGENMVTKAELEAQLAQAEAERDKYKRDVEELLDKTEALLNAKTPVIEVKQPTVEEKKEVRPPAGGGWVITAPNDRYFGKTLGVPFKAGIALIPAEATEGPAIIDKMISDFSYKVHMVTEESFNQILRDQAFLPSDAPPQSMDEKLVQARVLQ